jgi:hypothetical protein
MVWSGSLSGGMSVCVMFWLFTLRSHWVLSCFGKGLSYFMSTCGPRACLFSAGAQLSSSLSSALLEVPWVAPWLWAPGGVDIAAGALAAACFWLEGFWPSSAFV